MGYNDEKCKLSVRDKIDQYRMNGGPPSRLQELIAKDSKVSCTFKGNPFFDPWAPGGAFNKNPRRK